MVNIVIFGETGAGKSAVINLMAGQQVARTSPDSHRCTLQWTEYTITLDNGTRYQVFDTVGLEEPRLDSGEYLITITNAYSLINALKERGGINLLLFCIRGGRVTATMQSHYRLFFEFLCEEKVPLVLVVTNLEREERMEDWYTRNVGHLEKYAIHSVGHACITAATTIDGRHRARYEESRVIVCGLVRAHCNTLTERWTGGQGWTEGLIASLLGFAAGRPKKTDVIGVLTKRCGMAKAAAQQVAQQIGNEWLFPYEPYLAYGNDKKTTPRMIQSGAPVSKIQGVTQQDTQPESPTPSYLDIDATNPFARPGGDDNMENPTSNDPYTDFFQSSLPSTLSNTSPNHRPWNVFFIPSLLRPPVAASVRLHEHLKRCFFAHSTEQTPEGKVRAGDEDKKHDKDLPDTSSPDDPLPPAKSDSNDNRKLSKFFVRVRRKDTMSGKQTLAKTTCGLSPEAVEAPTGSVSQAGPSSHVGLVHNTPSPMTFGQSSEPSRLSAACVAPRDSRWSHLSMASHMWNTLILSRHPPVANELAQRSKHSFFSQRTGPQPVTVYAARPKKLYWMASPTVLPAGQSVKQGDGNKNANAQTVQSSSAIVHSSAAQSDSGQYTLQSPQIQAATQATPHEHDYGCWGNFCLVLGGIGRRPVVCHSSCCPVTSR